jgi:hypothetical protein
VNKGQALVIVIMIMVIALAFGLTISTRFIKSLHVASEADFAARAVGVAESAVEHVLLFSTSELEEFISDDTCGSDCIRTIIDDDGVVSTATVALSHLGNSSNAYEFFANSNETIEVGLDSYGGSDLDVCWNENNASVYAAYVKNNSSDYSLDTYAYNSLDPSDSFNGFDAPTAAHGYANCFTVVMSATPVSLRLKPLYSDATLVIVPSDGFALPSQGILIESTGVTESVTKKIQVVRSGSSLPGIFDYVLYQKSPSVSLSN